MTNFHPQKKVLLYHLLVLTTLQTNFFSMYVVRKEVPITVKRKFDTLRGRYGGTFISVFNLMKVCDLEEMKDYFFAGFEETREEVETIKSVDELKNFLMRRSSFDDCTILEDLTEFLQLADGQKFLKEYTTFRDSMYEKILAEDFALEVKDEHIKNKETKVCLHCESLSVKSVSEQICYCLHL